MNLSPGLQAAIAGRYVLEREIGAGGMANVYLAHDVRHDRRVALKVLRPELSAVIGAQRFLAEIRTTANLQHPHILPLYDSGEADGTVFYVMPYVAGESLRDRLEREKQLPVDDAVRIASEVADGLDYAHRNDVVHRDIKPENILLHDGRALIADFGIALAVSRADTASRMTETGMSLGTPHYMSPEQAMGERDITARSDVYALGCVLYEMLVGEPPFTGPTAQAIVARVVTEQPRSIMAQRRTVPPHVDAAVHRAVEKLPADRFSGAAAFAAALRDGASETRRVAIPSTQRSSRFGLVSATTFVVMAALAAWGWFRPDNREPETRRIRLAFPTDKFPTGLMQLTATGETFAYAGPVAADGFQRLYVKHRDKLDADEIPGTGPYTTFALSPDGGSVAFIVGIGEIGQLQRLPVGGGTPITLADSAVGFGTAWLRDGAVVYARRVGNGFSLWKVPAAGGASERLWAPDSTGVLAMPNPGPDGQVLVVRHGVDNTRSLWTVDVRSGDAAKLIDGALHGFWTASGHIVYGTNDGNIYSIGYDARRRVTIGAPVVVLQDVEVWYGVVPLFAVSESGTLIARLGPPQTGALHHAVFVDRDGRVTDIDSTWVFDPFAPGVNVGVSLSPDGTRLATAIADGTRSSIWIKPVGAGAPSRLTFDGTNDARPRWTPDGKAITFIRGRNGRYALFQKNVNGTGGERLIASAPLPILEAQYSRDMQWMVLRLGEGTTHTRDIHVMRVGVDSVPRPLIVSPDYDVSAVALSPDGKWIAFQSMETGTMEIFVRPFPEVDAGKWQVSRSGGFSPMWNPKGGELFFLANQRDMMSVRIGDGESPDLSTPRRMFTLPPEVYVGVLEAYTPHSLTPDGNRFVMLRAELVKDGERSIAMLEHFLRK